MSKEEEVEKYRNGSAHVNGKEEEVNSSEFAVPVMEYKSDLSTCSSQQEEVDDDGSGTNNQCRGTEAENSQLQPLDASVANTITEAPSISTKGLGLKKWRRISRRDHHVTKEMENSGKEREREREKDSDSDSNSTGRMLKRGSANILNENNGRVSSSSSSILPTHTHTTMATAIPIARTFNAGADGSRGSSKSSTKAQGHHHHQHHHHFRDKNVSAKTIKMGKYQPQPDPTKKARGGSLDKEKEKESSPLSSLDSDSRSCNSVFIRPSRQVPIPTPSIPLSLDGEDILPPPPPSQQRPATPTHSSDQLSSSANQGTSCDPLVDSILMLQAAQLALQTELHKFGEIGKGLCSLYDDSDKTSGVAVQAYMDRASMCDGWKDINDRYLSKIVQTLERRLNEAEGNLKEKELRISELETTVRSTCMDSPKDHLMSAMEQQYIRCIEMEAELQDLFKQKLEAEVQSVVITRSTKDLSVLVDTKCVPREGDQFPKRMVGVKNGTGQAEKSDTTYTREEILDMQRGVVKFTKCLVMQLVLLVVVFALFGIQLVPRSAVVVPT